MARVLFDPATDYYRLLGCRPGASSEELQAAYRRLAKIYHPDLHAGSTIAAARMARVNMAKSVLLDPATRAAYDRMRALRSQVVAAPPPVAHSVAYRPPYVQAAPRPHRPTIRPARRSGLDRQTSIVLLFLIPLIGALVMYVAEAVHISSQPVRASPADLALSPVGRPTSRGTAEAAFLMLNGQPPSRSLGQKAFNLIMSHSDASPEGELLRAVARDLVRAGAAQDVDGWRASVSELCALAGHC
jgi:curved DNA-binding protein CbpA